jgi:hypothetical protein
MRDACDCQHSNSQNVRWQYYLSVKLLQFWLVVLSALLMRYGTKMKKEKGLRKAKHQLKVDMVRALPCFVTI